MKAAGLDVWLVKAAGLTGLPCICKEYGRKREADGATTNNVAEERPTEFHANGSLASRSPGETMQECVTCETASSLGGQLCVSTGRFLSEAYAYQ